MHIEVAFFIYTLFDAVSGVFLAERINTFLGHNWKSFSSQGLSISVVWSGPLVMITILILVITFLSS
jgi:transmembrane protein 18